MKYGDALNRNVRALCVPQARASPTTFALMIQPMAALAQDAVGNASLPRDLTPWGMFMNADDEVVKAGRTDRTCLRFRGHLDRMLAKTVEILSAKRRVQTALNVLASVRSISEGIERSANAEGEVRKLLDAAETELKLSTRSMEPDSIKERIPSRLERIEAGYGRRILRGTGILATIGATSPFVGLFGTVWGIMNSFIGISKSHTTNLAVVAPGIAEALLATAFGLAAAIPAVVIYNMFARSIAGYRALLGDAAAEVLRFVGRQAGMPVSSARQSTPLSSAK